MPNRPRDDAAILDPEATRQAEGNFQAKIESDFLAAVTTSRFVFNSNVFAAQEKLWVQGNQLHFHAVSQNAPAENRAYHVEEERNILTWLYQQQTGLAAIFGDDFKVSDGGPSVYRRWRVLLMQPGLARRAERLDKTSRFFAREMVDSAGIEPATPSV